MISVMFSIVSLAYYILIIRVVINRLTYNLHAEIQFLEIVFSDSMSDSVSNEQTKKTGLTSPKQGKDQI
jgi:hypothetical protein